MRKLVAGAMLAVTAAITPASAQDYPTRVIKLVVPFPAGGASDVLTRLLADALGDRLKQRVIVENKGGAGGNIGTNEVAKAAPDGYTLLLSSSGPLAANKTLFRKLPYDPQKDLEPVSLIATMPNMLVVNPRTIPVKTVGEFIDYVKKHPGKVNYSSIGNGSSQHLAGALFEHNLKLQMRHVPYRAAGQIVIDMLSGDVPASFQLIPNVRSHLGPDKIRPVALMAAKRSEALPDVPTMAEQGYPNVISAAWFGLLVPKGTPAPIVRKLSDLTIEIMKDPKMRERVIKIGAEPVYSTPKEFADFIAAEIRKWHDVITETGIKLN